MSRTKLIVKPTLSDRTMASFKAYLQNFLPKRHIVEHFDGMTTIYVARPEDAELINCQFGSLIAKVEKVR